jgi:hypothetical protein
MTTWTIRFRDAIAPLQRGFEEGDDGDVIALALDEADSLLRELPELKGSKASDLTGLLRDLKHGPAVLESAEELAIIGSRSRYGEGLDSKDAERATSLSELLAVALEGAIKGPGGKRPTKRTKRKATAHSAKRRNAKG